MTDTDHPDQGGTTMKLSRLTAVLIALLAITTITTEASAMYHAGMGRFMQRDPAGHADGMNQYQYVKSNPVRRVDPQGLWGSDVHNDLTSQWAKNEGYPQTAASAVGSWDEDVDGSAVSWGPGWAPIIGDQSYHFNRNLGGGPDSRLQHHTEHFLEARYACNWKRDRRDDPEEAVKQLGISLHPLQDWVAHGDYGVADTVSNGGIWVHHNKNSPQTPLAGKPTLSSYPDDPDLDAVGGPNGRPTSP